MKNGHYNESGACHDGKHATCAYGKCECVCHAPTPMNNDDEKEQAYEYLIIGVEDRRLYHMVKAGDVRRLTFWQRLKLLFL